MQGKQKHIQLIERALFASRWLQLPLLVGLLVALTILGLQFAIAIFEAVLNFRNLTRLDTILLTLDLIDMVLIANLIVMVALSGYQLFIMGVGYPSDPEHKTFRFDEAAGPLKFRIATTIVLISTIHMLHAYLDNKPLEPGMIVQLAVFQTLFILTAVVLAVIHRILPHHGAPRQTGDADTDLKGD
ncbi:YqhA family protein [Caenispirillum salinarum]|uniref:YqhA family protein n=1 Tax=Caenispirillum salinarum TaxID=859058 RepID=UPI0038506467